MIEIRRKTYKLFRLDQLQEMIHEAEWRIGSHIAGNLQIDDYVRRQAKLIHHWSEEIVSLLKEGSEKGV